MKRKKAFLQIMGCLMVGFTFCSHAGAQSNKTDTLPSFKYASAATHFLPLAAKKGLAGQRYRIEWALPVEAPVALLDTLAGGLRIRSFQPKNSTFLLHSASDEAYSLRPVYYDPSLQMPDLYQNTIVTDFAADLVSANHPYGPLAAGSLAQAAGFAYNPLRLIYLPGQKALGDAPPALVNQLYYLQQLPVTANPDTLTTWVSTFRLLQLLEQDPANRVDGKAYLGYRLLDMLLGITSRNEQGWQWHGRPTTSGMLYTPVPQGYEAAFPLYEGKLVSFAKIVAPIKHLVSFEGQFPDPQRLNEKLLHLDRRLLAGMDEQDWKAMATHLQRSLTNEVLQSALQQMPAAVQTTSKEIAGKLQSRRDQLLNFALKYYNLLAGRVDVLASNAPEYFQISGRQNGAVAVNIFALDANGKPSGDTLFTRTFLPQATKEINLYGIGGKDQFDAEGELSKRIKLRIIGGPQQDSLRNRSRSGSLLVYDNTTNSYALGSHSRYHLRNNAEVHRYDFDAFAFNKKGLSPMVMYSNNDRLYVGLAYNNTIQGWRKMPFAQRHKAYLNYSILQGGISAGYEAIFNQLIGRWNGLFSTEYDAVRWNNFFGNGNESPPQVLDNDFHRVRSATFSADAGLSRPLGRHHSLGITGRFQTVRLRQDQDRFVAKTMGQTDPDLFRTQQFAGGKLTYTFSYVNHPFIPSKGLLFNASGTYTKNIKTPSREVRNYAGSLQFFVPLSRRLVFTSLGGVQAISGQPEFYQLASLGGTATLRGYRRERFWGKTALYNQNELQYLMPVRSYWFNGTLGLMALLDAGRIRQPGEQSNKLHTGYGAGILLVPFNKLLISVAYARSEERGMLHIGYRGRL